MVLDALREIKRHIQDANEFLSGLPITECPEGKLTEALSRKYERLRVWLLVLEEFQVYFELPDQKKNAEIADLLAFIQAVGPSVGVILISSSQKPAGVGAGDVSRLFNRFRDLHTVRFALKCASRVVSEAILGTEAYGEGFDASALPASKRYRGVGILYDCPDLDEGATVRTYLADGQDAEVILLAAREHRLKAGTLSGMAADEELSKPGRDVFADVLSVFADAESGQHWGTLADRLAAQIPERWEGVTSDALSAQLRGLGIPSVPVKVARVPGRGCRRADLEHAMGQR
jgi:S-DNA-T family DNA segregation ATPase FtsK/SpoIIIE